MKTTTPKPILCGTDFSENARQAASVAAALAQRLDAPLWLVHVTSEPLPADIPAAVDGSLAWEPMRSRLLMEGERLRSLGAVVEERMITGTPDEELAGLGAAIQRPLDRGFLAGAERGRALAAWQCRGAHGGVVACSDAGGARSRAVRGVGARASGR